MAGNGRSKRALLILTVLRARVVGSYRRAARAISKDKKTILEAVPLSNLTLAV